MESRGRSPLTLVVLILVVILVIFGGIWFVNRDKLVSPVPEEGVIRIIFITPTPVSLPPTVTPESTIKKVQKAPVKLAATITPTPKKGVTTTTSATITVKPSISPTIKPTPSSVP